jgi:hypothetical protein
MEDSCKNETTPGALLPNQEHLLLVAVIDLEFGQRVGGLSDDLALANASGVGEELLLEVLSDPLFDNDEVGVVL